MAGPRRSGPKPDRPPGDGRRWRPSWLHLAIALAVLAAGFASLWLPAPAPEGAATVTATSMPSSVATTAAATAPSDAASTALRSEPSSVAVGPAPAADISRARDPSGDPTPDISAFVNKGERPTMPEVIDRLHAAGVEGGLAAFSPPGTRPPLIGIAAPEGFELPEGYVRHYQATDDGQRIEPILMFAPDRQFFDAAHRPIAIPKDRVVPPELAPPGLPIRRIVVPAPAEPGR